jgi:hypothetical protein
MTKKKKKTTTKKNINKPSPKLCKKRCENSCENSCGKEKAYGDPNPVVPVEKICPPPILEPESLWIKIKRFLGLS